MKRRMATVLLFSLFGTIGCTNQPIQQSSAKKDDTIAPMDAIETKTFSVKLVDNKKDPTCGMPVTAGIADTLHFEGKVLGFCSSECKAEFLRK
jgi:hypothetical protein